MEIFGRELVDMPDLGDALFLFGIDAFFLMIIVRGIYMRISKSREHVFTFFIFNIVIFFLCAMLSSVKLKVGFAFGLFAILSILRYRTETVPIKEMTFLFVCLTIGVINSLVSKKVSIIEILATNTIITASIYVIEKIWLRTYSSTKQIKYENIDLIRPEKRQEMIDDLSTRLGYKVTDVEIGSVDFLNDTAIVKVFYDELKG